MRFSLIHIVASPYRLTTNYKLEKSLDVVDEMVVSSGLNSQPCYLQHMPSIWVDQLLRLHVVPEFNLSLLLSMMFASAACQGGRLRRQARTCAPCPLDDTWGVHK